MPAPTKSSARVDRAEDDDDDELERHVGKNGAVSVADDDLVIDLSAVPEAPVFEAVPGGFYDCKVEDASLVPVKSKPSERQVRWKYRIERGEFKGRYLFMYSGLNEKGLPFLRRAISRINPETDLTAVDLTKLNYEVGGKPCRLRVTAEPDNRDPNVKVNRVQEVMPAVEDRAKMFDDDDDDD